MQTEFEATIANIDKIIIRKKLESVQAQLIHPEFLMKRTVFSLPSSAAVTGRKWLRVRAEADKITLSLKSAGDQGRIEDQKEIELTINDYEAAVELLMLIGCEQKAYQETLRETWKLDNAVITLDEWPYLEPFVEIESDSEAIIKSVAGKLGFDYSQAYFGPVDGLYSRKYNIPIARINEDTPLIKFNMDANPFT